VRKGSEERYREYVHRKSEGGSVFVAGVNWMSGEDKLENLL
jgi:hypothetical protein